MLIKDFLPPVALREFIRCYRIVHFEFEQTAEPPFKIYTPKPEEVLLFYLKDRESMDLATGEKKDYHFSVALLGQQTAAIKRYAGKSFLNLQIVFQPTALYRLTGLPSTELAGKYVNAEDIFGFHIQFTLEALQESKSYQCMLEQANRFIHRLIGDAKKEAHALDHVSRYMIQQAGNVPLDWLAKQTNLCTKQFKRKFNERAGVNPKTYSGIIKFNKAYNLKNAHPDWDALKWAIESNYYDYQHLVKSYQRFTGLHPSLIHQIELGSPENRLGLAAELYQSRIKPLA